MSLDLKADMTKGSSPLELRPDTRHASVKHGFETMAKLLVKGRYEATVPSSAVLFSASWVSFGVDNGQISLSTVTRPPFRPWFTLSVFRLLLGQKRISTKADQAVKKTRPLETHERYPRVGNRRGR